MENTALKNKISSYRNVLVIRIILFITEFLAENHFKYQYSQALQVNSYSFGTVFKQKSKSDSL